MPRVRVVLVRPEAPANVGAVARVLRNTGLDELSLVQPGDWRTLECWRTAWGAHEVLEEARTWEGLAEALAGSVLSAGFSGRPEPGLPPLDVREVARQVAALPTGALACLVFGPETSGLSADERALCGRLARIPSHAAQPSLNLSHAVMVAAHEVFRASAPPPPTPPRWSTHEEKERLLDRLQEGLQALGALAPPHVEAYRRVWRALLHRLDLTPSEVRMIEHVAWRMRRVRPR